MMGHLYTKNYKDIAYSAIIDWADRYRQEARQCRYGISTSAPPYLHGELDFIRQAKKDRDATIEFIQRYSAYILLDGLSPEVLGRLERFLSYQHYNDDFHMDGNIPSFNVTFQGPGMGGKVTVRVENLYELDFADSYGILNYEFIQLSNRQWKTYTQKRVDRVITEIKDDLEFDSYEADITLSIGKAGQSAENSIELLCIVH